MTSGHFKPQAEFTGSPALRLEIAGQEANTPLLIPVLIRNLSNGGVTLTMTNPGDIPDWDRYRGEDCVLRVRRPWRRPTGQYQSPDSLDQVRRHWSAALVSGIGTD